MTIPILRTEFPRLFRPADDPGYRFAPARDRVRKGIVRGLVADCEAYAAQRPWRRIAERLDSPHPYHQLYITFYSGMHATALIEQYAFAWLLTKDGRWLKKARQWLLAAAEWEHSDRVEEHFYTANRYMHAFAVALDWMGGELTPGEKDRVTECLVRVMGRWWPDVERGRCSPVGGHHAVVDNGHFGVAALHLLGEHPDAPKWVEAVVERFRSGIMPNGCGRDGEPVDGPGFWAWENLWMLQFGDALRNVTGIDLYREFPRRVSRPLTWLRYQVNATLTGEEQLRASAPALLRLAQMTGDGELRDVALADAQMGRLYSFQAGVKGSPAECILSSAPSAYCFYDPDFAPRPRRIAPAPSKTFTRAHYGETGVLRDHWGADALVACISGYRGGAAHGFSNLHLQWGGKPALTTISSEEAQPVGCGSLPCVGGQNEVVAALGHLQSHTTFDRLAVRSIRTDQEYWLLRGRSPILVAALRRRPRGVKVVHRGAAAFARLNGKDYLQYPREPYFNPDSGELRILFRLNEEVDPDRDLVLFSTGIKGTGVNSFTLGFLKGKALTFAVRSQRANLVQVAAPSGAGGVSPHRWHETGIRWGGFNDPKGKPFIEVTLDGHTERCDDPARFGELGKDSQNLQSRSRPRTFFIKSTTLLAFGGAVQMPATAVKCDLGRLVLRCPGRRPLVVGFEDGVGEETGGGPLVWKLNPVRLTLLRRGLARVQAGSRTVEVVPVFPPDAAFSREVVPYAPSGLAAGSLRSLRPAAGKSVTRLRASTTGDILVLAFAEGGTKILPLADGFEVRPGMTRMAFEAMARGRGILRLK